MIDGEVEALVQAAIGAVGRDRVAEELAALAKAKHEEHTLTLVSNAGVHTIPPQYLRGEVYEVSRGNWNATGAIELGEELTDLLSELAKKLRSRPWRTVYLIPTGHPILSIHVKLIVYRLLRINTIDLYYGNGEYLEVHLDHRQISLALESHASGDGA